MEQVGGYDTVKVFGLHLATLLTVSSGSRCQGECEQRAAGEVTPFQGTAHGLFPGRIGFYFTVAFLREFD